MSRKLISAQAPFKMLVPCLTGGSDPSRGPSGNPVLKRKTMEIQTFVEIPGRGPEVGSRDGVRPRLGLLTGSPPAGAEGTIRVSSSAFDGALTSLHLGEFVLSSGEEFDISGKSYEDEDITNTPPDGVIVLWKTAGAGMGEGTIDVPTHLPIDAGGVTISWTSGATTKSQTDDGEGGFSGDGNPAGSSINYTTGAIVLDTTGDIPDNATTITISYSNVLTGLASAIDDLPGYSSSMSDGILQIAGPSGPLGNEIRFEVRGASTWNFVLDPDNGMLGSAVPEIGPPSIE